MSIPMVFLDHNLSLSIVKTEDIGSHSPAESEGSDEDEKDVDSAGGEKTSKYLIKSI